MSLGTLILVLESTVSWSIKTEKCLKSLSRTTPVDQLQTLGHGSNQPASTGIHMVAHSRAAKKKSLWYNTLNIKSAKLTPQSHETRASWCPWWKESNKIKLFYNNLLLLRILKYKQKLLQDSVSNHKATVTKTC